MNYKQDSKIFVEGPIDDSHLHFEGAAALVEAVA